MDDLDRLDRSEVQVVFRLIKLSADFARVTYVLAFDPARVAQAIGPMYGAGDEEAGRSFLEKIVQVPLYVPQADSLALRAIAFRGVDMALTAAGVELTSDQAQRFVNEYALGVESRVSTPRMAKKYGNALKFALISLRYQLDHVDLMLMEALRIFYPEVWEVIRGDPNLFVEDTNDERDKARRSDPAPLSRTVCFLDDHAASAAAVNRRS